MKLTGKCKEDFEKWFTKDIEDFENYDQHLLNEFYKQIYSMQYGVYVDFFDSVNVYVTEIPHWCKGIKSFRIGFHILKGCVINSLFVRPDNTVYDFIEFNSRPEARTAAIEKANEIYNKQE
jgi:hypothetical protein